MQIVNGDKDLSFFMRIRGEAGPDTRAAFSANWELTGMPSAGT